MKRTISTILTVVICISMLAVLAACGATVDREPLRQAYATAAASFNALATIVNENADAIDEATIEQYQKMSDLLDEYCAKIESDENLTQEQADKMQKWLEEDLTNYCITATQQFSNFFAQ